MGSSLSIHPSSDWLIIKFSAARVEDWLAEPYTQIHFVGGFMIGWLNLSGYEVYQTDLRAVPFSISMS